MITNRFRATVVLSSDHAGINVALTRLEASILRVLARLEDPRQVRDYVEHLYGQSQDWCERGAVDGRGWQARLRK